MQGLQLREQGGGGGGALEERLRMAEEENQLLKRENESLRSLAQGGGDVAVPRDLVDRVEKESGLRFESSPVVRRVGEGELRERVAAAIEARLGPSGADDRQEAWRLLGVLGKQDDLLHLLSAVRSTGARVWFDETTGEGWVAPDFRVEDIPEQAALLRLLTRMVIHQHFPVPPSYPGDDEARALDALHQGIASGAETRFLSAAARTVGFLPMKQNPDAARLFATLPSFVRGLTMFPAVEGKAFADTLHIRGEESVHAVLADPPRSTSGVLLPGAVVDERLFEGWDARLREPYLVEGMGQLGLRLWIESVEGVRGGEAGLPRCGAWESWVGDRYALVPDGEASAAVVWELAFADEAAARGFADFVAGWIGGIAGAKQVAVGPDEVFLDGEGRSLAFSRPSPTRVRLVNAASREMAGAWLVQKP